MRHCRIWSVRRKIHRAGPRTWLPSAPPPDAWPGAGVHALTKFRVAAFSESLRQELIGQRVRVSVAGPGTVDTELASHLREDIQHAARTQPESIGPLRPTASLPFVAVVGRTV